MKKFILLTISMLCLTQISFAQKKKKKSDKNNVTANAAPAASSIKIKDISSFTKSMIKQEGFITFYQDTSNGKAYMSLSKENLNTPMIYFTYAENGLVNMRLNKGMYRENAVITFEKQFNSINIKKIKTGQYFNLNNPISKAKDANISDAFVSAEKIVAEDKNNYIISADDVLGSETMHQLSINIPRGMPFPFQTGRINPTKTYAKKIRSYPENADIIYSYTFDNAGTFTNDGTMADERYVTVEVQHSFIQMPDSNFKPRYDDERIGYFSHQINDMTNVESTNYKDVIHRWRLEKKDQNIAISEPIKPIVWWIENTTPKELIPLIQKAGETWNLAFEPLGYKNAVVVKVQPDSASWDAGDIRYNVLRWTSSPNPPFGGYGPSFVNPLTGEILGADIMLEWVFLTNRVVTKSTFQPNGEANHSCDFGNHLHEANLFGQAASNGKENALDENGQLMLTPILEQSIFYLILHEMGHTFGLNHNMKASQLHSPADLQNEMLTSKVGLMGSVMDYPAINFAPKGTKQGQYYSTRPGPYDLWAIDFGYSNGLINETDENKRLDKILSKSFQKELTFGNDADDMRSPGKAIDPRVMIGDLSADAITFAKERMELCQMLMDSALFNYTNTGDNFHDVRQKTLILAKEYAIQAGVVSRYIGGVYVERGDQGDKGETKPYTPVSAADQKRAMNLLASNVFSAVPLSLSPDLIAKMQPQRRGFGFFSTTEDPKIHAVVLDMQKDVLDHLLSNSVLNRIVESETYGNAYNITLMMNDLTAAIFKADVSGNVSTFRQNLQIEFTERLIRIADLDKNSKIPNKYNNIAKARAYANLIKLEALLKQGKSSGDIGSQQHKAYVLMLIESANK